MKTNVKKLALCLIVPLAVGGLSAFLTREAMEQFQKLNKPPLTPPGWVFPAVWTVLYLMMGLASYLVWQSRGPRRAVRNALTVYGVQLGFNFMWTILFFNMGWYLFAFVWLIALWVLILATAVRFYRLSGTAGYLMVPYLIWVTFAGYLNFGIFLMN